MFFSVYHTEEGDQFDFSESESSSVEFLYYWDGFQVVHYWLSSPSARGLRDVTLTAADIDPPFPLPLPLSSHQEHLRGFFSSSSPFEYYTKKKNKQHEDVGKGRKWLWYFI